MNNYNCVFKTSKLLHFSPIKTKINIFVKYTIHNFDLCFKVIYILRGGIDGHGRWSYPKVQTMVLYLFIRSNLAFSLSAWYIFFFGFLKSQRSMNLQFLTSSNEMCRGHWHLWCFLMCIANSDRLASLMFQIGQVKTKILILWNLSKWALYLDNFLKWWPDPVQPVTGQATPPFGHYFPSPSWKRFGLASTLKWDKTCPSSMDSVSTGIDFSWGITSGTQRNGGTTSSYGLKWSTCIVMHDHSGVFWIL